MPEEQSQQERLPQKAHESVKSGKEGREQSQKMRDLKPDEVALVEQYLNSLDIGDSTTAVFPKLSEIGAPVVHYLAKHKKLRHD